MRGAISRAAVMLLTCVGIALAIAACGSSASGSAASSDPGTLLRDTFARDHAIRSGVLSLDLVVTPQGSSVISAPLSLSMSGPFASRGRGRAPESALTFAFSGLGHHASFGVRTTASGDYVTLEGVNYRLPAADSARLHSEFGTGGSAGSTPGLSSLGVDPRSWLSDPRIVGSQTIDGVSTEHLRATVDVAAFLRGVDMVLARDAAALHRTTGAARSIAPAQIRRIAADVRSPTVDLYVDRTDATLRRMRIEATVPVSGTASARLGGLRTATFALTAGYSEVDQPQTIAAPGDVHSPAQLQAALRSIAARLRSEFGGGLTPRTGGDISLRSPVTAAVAGS